MWVANLTTRVAQKSKYVLHKHGAVIIKGGKLASKATNSPKPMISYESCNIHAECAALKKTDAHGATLYVARICNGKIGLSKPCSKCEKKIKKAGIKRVYYTTRTGWDYYDL
jgi:deoxycytidylate deaminase